MNIKLQKNALLLTRPWCPWDPSPASSVAKDKPKKRHSSPAKSTKGATDSKLEAMDLKWSERFSRLEALLLLKTISARSVFSAG